MSIINLNANDLNNPIGRLRLSEWIKKTRPEYVVYKKPTINIKTQIDEK